MDWERKHCFLTSLIFLCHCKKSWLLLHIYWFHSNCVMINFAAFPCTSYYWVVHTFLGTWYLTNTLRRFLQIGHTSPWTQRIILVKIQRSGHCVFTFISFSECKITEKPGWTSSHLFYLYVSYFPRRRLCPCSVSRPSLVSLRSAMNHTNGEWHSLWLYPSCKPLGFNFPLW